MKKKSLWSAIAIYLGTIIGAGIFALPYVFSQSGFIIGFIWLILLALTVTILCLSYGEVVLRTPQDLEMAGYAQEYLGRRSKILITISLVLGNYTALTAYIVGIGNFLNDLFQTISFDPLIWGIIFWALASFILYLGIKVVSHLELIMGGAMALIIFLVLIGSWDSIDLSNFTYFNLEQFWLPMGAILFSLGVISAIPTMKRVLKNNPVSLKKAIIKGQIITVVLYLVFIIAILGVAGENTSSQAISSLEGTVSQPLLILGIVLSILTMTTSFLILGHILEKCYSQDWGIPRIAAWSMVVGPPLILVVCGLNDFVALISLAGGLLMGLQGILLLFTWKEARKKGKRQPEYTIKIPPFVFYFILLIFTLSIIYQLITLL